MPLTFDGLKAATPTQTVIYKTTTDAQGGEVSLELHIFEPEGHRPEHSTPAILFFFGGGWNKGAPTAFRAHSSYFASRGIVAISADYRVMSRQGTSPFEAVSDAKSAVRYLRAHAAELGIAPQRIVASGSSAGGHLAACTAILPGLDEPSEDTTISSIPNLTVLYNPVVDASPAGYGRDRFGPNWEQISPLHHVRPGLPPTLLFHGTGDTTTPYANSAKFEAAMQADGNDCRLVTYPDLGHGFVYQMHNACANHAVRTTDEFLVSHGYMTGEPTLPAPTE